VEAHIHFNLYSNLQQAIPHYQEELNQSTAFWSLTIRAHLDASVVRLCKIYEHHQGSLNLRNLLDTIQANIAFFDTVHFRERHKDNPFVESLSVEARKPDEKQLQKDIDYVTGKDKDEEQSKEDSRKNNPVKSLMMWRHKVVAHRDTHFIIRQKNLADDYRLTIADIAELLMKADEILNRYSILFDACAYSMHMIREDDYLLPDTF